MVIKEKAFVYFVFYVWWPVKHANNVPDELHVSTTMT